jgi:hypothetical protein
MRRQQMNKTQLTDRLWVGNKDDAQECLSDPNFAIITVAWDSPVVGHHHFQLTDPGNHEDDRKLYFGAADKAIEILETSEKNLLIHCFSGINRSPSVCIGVLMKTENKSLFEAYDLVYQRRPIIWPFERHLESAFAYNNQDIMSLTSLPSYAPKHCV